MFLDTNLAAVGIRRCGRYSCFCYDLSPASWYSLNPHQVLWQQFRGQHVPVCPLYSANKKYMNVNLFMPLAVEVRV